MEERTQMAERLEPFAELLAAEGVPEETRRWVLALTGFALEGAPVDTLSLEHVHPQVAYGLGAVMGEQLRALQRERDEFRESALMYAAAQTEQVPGLQYLLWDMERQMWWAPARRGYTDEQDKAGRYSQAEAVELALSGSLGGLRHATVIVADHGSVKRS